ncbi:hypothetical protein JCM39194_25420 [Desulfotomaculum varum]
MSLYLMAWTILVFVTVFLLIAGINSWRQKNTLIKILNQGSKAKGKKQKEETSFLCSLWGVSEARVNKIQKTAVICSITAFLLGLAVSMAVAIILAAAAFIFIPKMLIKVEKDKQRALFIKQFPKAVSEIAALAETTSIAEGIASVAKNFPSPAAEVFKQINAYIEMREDMYTAINKTAAEYQFPGLSELAESIKIINEIGGDKAPKILFETAEKITFTQKVSSKINTAVAGVTKEMTMGSIAIVGIFIVTAGPGSPTWEITSKHPILLLAGFGSLVTGWVLAYQKISGLKNKAFL